MSIHTGMKFRIIKSSIRLKPYKFRSVNSFLNLYGFFMFLDVFNKDVSYTERKEILKEGIYAN